jgi:hypothetical protein
MLEGFTAAEVLAEDRRLALKTTTTPAAGRADVLIPAFAHSPKITINWIDAYR